MGIDARIIDGKASDRAAQVDPQQNLCTIQAPLPPFGGGQKMRVFRQYLTDDGLSNGTSGMDVDGSSTNVDYYIQADPTKDRYICMLSFAIVDASQSLSEFANSNAALSNGCRLFYSDQQGDVDIHDALKTNFDFIRLCGGNPAFGDGAGAFLANNVASTSEGYIPVLDMRRTFGFQWGVRLAAGTKQRITLTIRDDCTAADQFDCIAYGFERLE